MALSAFLAMLLLLLLLSVAAGSARADGGDAAVPSPACGCPVPAKGSEVCGSNRRTHASQCHLECASSLLPYGIRKVSDGACNPWENCLEDCERLLKQPVASTCNAKTPDCWAENIKATARVAANCTCGCRVHYGSSAGGGRGDDLDKLTVGLLKATVLGSEEPAQTQRCLLAAIKDASQCGSRCTSPIRCIFDCNKNWFEAMCQCRSTGD